MSTERSAAFKRLIRKYEFLLEDWADVAEISKSANLEMMREINLRKPKDITEDDFTVEEKEDEETEKEEETPEDKVLKKLFRKIVFKSHPDRLGSDISELERVRIISLYDQAVSAHDDKNWALMIITAIKLGVELPEEAESMVDKISEEAAELEEKIANETSGIAWQFYHAAEEEKEKIVERYLNLLNQSITRKAEEKKEKASKLILGVGHPRTGTGYTAKLLQSWGLDVGHEVMGEHGTVDWSLSAGGQSLWQDANFKDFEWKHIIYCVRDPRESIPSIVYTEDIIESSKSFRAREFSIKDKHPVLFAINSIIQLDRIVRMSINPSFILKIEDGAEKLFSELQDSLEITWSDKFVNISQNKREHPNFKEMIKEYGGEEYLKALNRYCKIYGYKLF